MSNSIEERVIKVIAEQLSVDEAQVKPEAAFIDDLGADSLDLVELVMSLEKEFDCEIPDEDAEKITTVQTAKPRMAAIAPAPGATASCMILPRMWTSWMASAKLIAPAAQRAVYSPSEWPAIKGALMPHSSRRISAQAIPAASSAGWVMAVWSS